jgi:hypothetical protein
MSTVAGNGHHKRLRKECSLVTVSGSMENWFRKMFDNSCRRTEGYLAAMIEAEKRALKATLTQGISAILGELVDLYSSNLGDLGE